MAKNIIAAMPWWHKISIRNKLKFSILSFALLTFAIFTLTVNFSANAYFHKKKQEDLNILANVFSENIRASIVFNDPETTKIILGSLKLNPRISKAIVYKDKKIFAVYPQNATYNSQETESKNTNGIWLHGESYYISVPIIVTHKVIGSLLLVSDLKDWDALHRNRATIFFIILVCLVVLTYIISLWLESQITKPLSEISEWAMKATQTNNFAIRVEKKNDDEIGNLIDSLNKMLSALTQQESILALNKKLTYQIQERENAEKALILLRDQAEIANKSKSIFLANMSHEIRTPLNGVIGMTNVLLTTNLNEIQAGYAETIKHSGQALLTIINEILDFSKIESGRFHLENIEFNLQRLLDEVMEIIAPLAYAKNLAIGALVEHDVPVTIKGDPARLRQILTNLLGNAIKFTEKGEIELNVKMLKKEKKELSTNDIFFTF